MRAPRRSLALALALASAIALVGCTLAPGALQRSNTNADPATDLVEKLLDLGQVLDVRVPLKDGPKLHGTVYVPKVENGTRMPVVMDLGPYYGSLGADTSTYSKDHPPSLLYEHFLRRGYAVALVSVRGTGQSEGCFMVGGKQEQSDAAAAVEWLAAQPWSNGNVAMTGVSYDGTTPWEAMAAGAPHLKAIVPVEGISDMYRYTFYEGAPVGTGPLFQTYYEAMVDYAYTDAGNAPAWLPNLATNACPGQPDVITNPYQTYVDGAHGTPYWRERDASAMIANSTVPVFMVHGFVDFNVKMDNVQWMWDAVHGPKRMLLGQWEHNIPWSDSYNKDWSYAAYNRTITQFLDAYLKENATARAAVEAAPPVLAQDSRGAWHELTQWPPAQSVDTPFYIVKGGKLSSTPPNESYAFSYQTWGPATTVTNLFPEPVPPASGSYSFATPTLEKPMLLMGNPTFNVTLSVDRPHGYVGVVLYDQAPDGTRTRVIPGYLNLAERDGRDVAKDVPTNTPMSLHVKLYATAHVVEAGHKLVLQLSGYTEGIPSGPPDAVSTTVKVAPDTPAVLWAPLYPLDARAEP